MQTAKLRRDQTDVRPPLLAGDIAPDCVLPDLAGATVNLLDDAIAGNPIVLLFCPKFSSSVREALAWVKTNLSLFQSAGARLFAVTEAPGDVAAGQEIPFPTLLDAGGAVFRAFSANRYDAPTTVVLRPNHHVAAIFNGAAQAQVQNALSVVEKLAAAKKPLAMGMHPPVLIIPEVLSQEDCKRLIEIFETRGQRFVDPGPGIDRFGADYKMRIPEHMREDRIDHWIFDKDTMAFLAHRLQRVWPEIRKAFQYRVTKQEALRIACYQGSRGGFLHGHRDDVPPTTYRRFAMSINLNTEEFEGGELRFPEFGDQRYRPENGMAIVFSSSLLHEALHVTAGRRLVVLAFLFGEY
jgi:peroxiredoxin